MKIHTPQSAILNRRCRRHRQFAQSLQHRPDHESPHLRFAAEAHFAFRRMHVHIDRRRIALEEDERERVAPLGQRLVVALDQRIVERAAVDRTCVHKHDHFVPRRAPRARPPDEPAQPLTRLRHLDRHERLGDLLAENLRDPLAERAALRRAKHHAPVLD